MLPPHTEDYLIDKKIKIFQPVDGYRAAIDAVLLSAMVTLPKNDGKILDVGSGTGAVSLCLAHRCQHQDMTVIGLELQPDLVELSNNSATQNNFDFLHFYHTDISKKPDPAICPPCSFDVVVSNPPYSDHDMPSPNPSKSAAHNHSSLNLTAWLKFCIKATKPSGYIHLINRTEALTEICTAVAGICGGLKILPIYSKTGQNSKRIIVSMQKDSKAPLQILPPLTIHKPDGSYTEQAQEILRNGKSIAEVLTLP
ncbi:MAG: methyltransferase domain-containing protein [Alphaproteobacteria bacterium]|nr:methyltransferase domain-containing protein [Alphaproteobacteria bacterium]